MIPTEKLVALIVAATPGPWKLHTRGDDRTMTNYSWSIWDEEGNVFILDMERKRQPPSREWVTKRTNDLSLIALTPTLATEVLSSRKRIAELEGALLKFVDHFGPLEDNHMLHEDARACFRLARVALGPEAHDAAISRALKDATP